MSGTRKREPVAEIGEDDYRIVRHTHDVDLAARLMRAEILRHDGCPLLTLDEMRAHLSAGTAHACTDECRAAVNLGKPRQVWVRIIPCLPNSYGAAEGWAAEYRDDAVPGSRGAFPAVVFA